MAGLGFACLVLALALCVYGIGASIYGVRSGRVEFSDSGRRAVYALAGMLTVAFAVLELAFLRNDFTFNTVADTSSRTTPEFYRAAAVWSSQEGSLLLWAWLLSMWASLALFLTRKRMRDIAAYATAILLGFAGFFVSLMIFYANPFKTTTPAPAEGVGLDPLLRFPTMMIHPPMLYSGYTLCTIPLAFGMGALLARRVDAEWIRSIRRFAFAAWLFLGMGILLGARWSYSELGWGGYWGWDAVENASLMPWLTGTAFLHSLMIQEKRGMLKVWNVSLVLATGTLAIMGTFLVRSGVLNSIHAFGGATLGVPFVVLIGVLIAGSIYLVVSRRDMLRSEHRLDSLLSRESIFVANNIVLVGLCFVIFWGTYFPLISEALTGQEASVGPPWFDRYTVPLALILVLLSGIGPVIAWRRATLANARRNFLIPIIGRAADAASVLLAAGIAAQARSDRDVLLRGLRVRERRAGVLQGHARAPGNGGRIDPPRPGGAGAPQPQALRRLHRPPRDRRPVRGGGRILVLPARLRARPLARPVHAGRRLHRPLRPPDGDDHAALRRRAHRAPRSASVRSSTSPSGGRQVATLNPSEGFYSSGDPTQGSVGSLIGGQPVSHIANNSSFTRDIWTAIAPDIEAPALQKIVKVGNATLSGEDGDRRDRLPGARVPEKPSARAVPFHRLAPGHVDLDRRDDRPGGRVDRNLARAEHCAPPRPGTLPLASGTRHGARLSPAAQTADHDGVSVRVALSAVVAAGARRAGRG